MPEWERAPRPPGVAGEGERRGVTGPRARWVHLVGVLEGAADAREDESALALVQELLGVQVVDPRVRGDAGHRCRRAVAAPIEPPERHALRLERLVQCEVGLGLWDAAPVPYLARAAGGEAPGVVGQRGAGERLRGGELWIV